jgi:hypothetical protein
MTTAERTLDAALVSELVGCDLSEVVANPLNICLIDGDNLAIFPWRGPDTYEAHVAFTARGREALTIAARMLDTMRSAYGARSFWTLIPVESRHVRMFARSIGFRSKGMLTTQHGPNELFVGD